MNRIANPQTQVALIKGFLQTKGTEVKHAEVRELVAKINGAANWNEMLAVQSRKKLVTHPHNTKASPIESLESLLPKLDAMLESSLEEDISQLEAQLNNLTESIARVRVANLERRRMEGESVVALTVPLNDAIEEDWNICRGALEFPIPVELLDAIKQQGQIVEAESCYPDARYYGMPATANMGIFEMMLKSDGWTVPSLAKLTARDTRDDTGEYARIFVSLPLELYERVTKIFVN